VLLNFWATWCAPCRREMPMLSKLQREYANQGLVVLYVSLEDPEVLTPFLAQNRFDGIQGRLDHAADFYDAGKFYPLSYLISRDGRVAQRWSGRPTETWLDQRVRAQL
jgi:thiol-disulfide isomerase/thioredoxin